LDGIIAFAINPNEGLFEFFLFIFFIALVKKLSIKNPKFDILPTFFLLALGGFFVEELHQFHMTNR